LPLWVPYIYICTYRWHPFSVCIFNLRFAYGLQFTPAVGTHRDKPVRTTVRMSDAKVTKKVGGPTTAASANGWFLKVSAATSTIDVLSRKWEQSQAHRHSVYQLNESHIINSLRRQAASRGPLSITNGYECGGINEPHTPRA